VRPLFRPLDRDDVDVARQMERPAPTGSGDAADDGRAALIGERRVAGVRIGQRGGRIRLNPLDGEAGSFEPRRDVALRVLLRAKHAGVPDELGGELEQLLAATGHSRAQCALALLGHAGARSPVTSSRPQGWKG
jgi:hypothetical protein